MRNRKRTITVNETATILSLKLKSGGMQRGWCSECATEVVWIELHTAMELFRVAMLSDKCVVHLKDERVCSLSLLNIKNREL